MKTKHFIKNFNFTNPDFSSVPNNFPGLSKTGLTREERHLLDAIVLAWITSEGRDYFLKRTARHTAIAVAIVFVLLAGGKVITTSQNTKTVNAKTVGNVVGDVIEATMSAVFR
jgi:hypothetical protein